MEEKNNGGPAFPVSTGSPDCPYQNGHATAQYPGLTMRDYFAAQCMAGSFARDRNRRLIVDAEECAKIAYQWADAMLKARES